MTLPGGGEQALLQMTVRATEFTTGADGENAMPGDLPDTSGYTYATEYSIDEAIAAAATKVEFDKPVLAYTPNFLDFPVGDDIPAGTYDERAGHLDRRGQRPRHQAARRSRRPRRRRGRRRGHPGGARTRSASPTASANSSRRCSPQAPSCGACPRTTSPPRTTTGPTGRRATRSRPTAARRRTTRRRPTASRRGSIIGCESQTLGERLPVTGTSYDLQYSSQRVPGRDGGALAAHPPHRRDRAAVPVRA